MMETDPIPLFAADVMLGRLARWLRATGLNVFYNNQASDDQLIQLFLNERRWIITRDRGLVRRRVLQRVIFIEAETLEEQLREFFEKTQFIFDRNLLRPFSRCVDCNNALLPLQPEQAEPRVPPYIFQHHDTFKLCPSCGKVFWAGTHRDRIQAFLKRAIPF
ncbi:MAG TPA: Mut7-C RNAse domain-containing protein [Acidobacteriota bacterium]